MGKELEDIVQSLYESSFKELDELDETCPDSDFLEAGRLMDLADAISTDETEDK